jgi:hypothetical protein
MKIKSCVWPDLFASAFAFALGGALLFAAHVASAQATPPQEPILCDPVLGCPPPPGTCTGLNCVYDLGSLPPEVAAIQWPRPPVTTSTVTVSSCSQLANALAVSARRIEIQAGSYSCGMRIERPDQDLVLASGAQLNGDIVLRRDLGQARTRIEGGLINGSILGDAVQDLLVHRVRTQNGGIMVGHVGGSDRVAIVSSSIDAPEYAVFTPAYAQNNDLIIADSDLVGGNPAGAQSTVRLQQVLRAVLLDNRIWNGGKHTYRVHSESDLIYARNNQFENTGTMMDNHDPGRIQCNRCWLVDNRWYRLSNSLVQIAPYDPTQQDGVNVLVMTDNVAYTDTMQNQFPGTSGPDWILLRNTVEPYRAPPPFSGGAP